METKKIAFLTFLIVVGLTLVGQVPQAFNYQGVARDVLGAVLPNQNLGLRISILQAGPQGTILYSEKHFVITNEIGLFSLEIGQGTTIDNFAAIDWADGQSKWIEIEMDATGGTNFLFMGNYQLLTVPYAMVSQSAANDADTDPANELQLISKIGNLVSLSENRGSFVDETNDSDADTTNELQTISKIGNLVTLSQNGGSFVDEKNDADADPANEFQHLTIAGNNLSLSDGNTVQIPSIGSKWTENGTDIFYNTGSVSIGTNLADSSALLDLASINKGFLPPRLTSQQRDAITNPAVGLTIFNCTTNCLNVFKPGGWWEMCGNCVTPSTPVIDSIGAICEGNTLFLNAHSAPGASYSWTGPDGFVANQASAIIQNVNQANAGLYSVVATNSCGTSPPAQINIPIGNIPTSPGSITGPALICEGSDSVLLYINSIPSAENYMWNLPPGISTNSPDDTAIYVHFEDTLSPAIITVSAQNQCGTSLASPDYLFKVNPLPGDASSVIGSSTVCEGEDSVLFHVSEIENTETYFWHIPSGVTVNGSLVNDSIYLSFPNYFPPTEIWVQGQNSCGIGNASSIFNIDVLPLPSTAGIIMGNDTVCQSQNGLSYAVLPIQNANSYQWDIPDGSYFVGSANGNIVHVNFSDSAQSGIISVVGQNSCGIGQPGPVFNVQVNPLPDVADAGPDQLQQTDTFTTLQAVPPVNGTGTWAIVNGMGGCFPIQATHLQSFQELPGIFMN